MSFGQKRKEGLIAGYQVAGHDDAYNAWYRKSSAINLSDVREGVVEQFNVGFYSALVSDGQDRYVCYTGAQNVTPGFGYSDICPLREGDRVIFSPPCDAAFGSGMILARVPREAAPSSDGGTSIESDNNETRRTAFFGNDCFLPKCKSYSTPALNENDLTVRNFCSNRPSDMVAGEFGTINQHRCGLIGNMYSMSVVGGGAHIRLFSLENRIRIVADCIHKVTSCGNEYEWHNRRYMSYEKTTCLYHEERLGLPGSTSGRPFEDADYQEDGYYTKNAEKRQTARPRLVEHKGYYGGLSTRYGVMPDPSDTKIRSMDDLPTDVGVARESLDPSGQYRLAAAGMLGFERIGRIPVPHRINYPWQNETTEPEAAELTPFEHSDENPGYRQLELADRVAYDLKNSYARVDGAPTEFYTPEEKDLEGKATDVYDQGFTNSSTVRLSKYDKRRSGIWQGEDGSIILRDAWGSEIVMLGGNIQLSCAGNVEILPGKTALTLAGDDIVQKAQNSVDIEAASNDVRVNGYRNVQILGGNDKESGGVTIEARGAAAPWDGKDPDGGEQMATSGILLKSSEGSVVADANNLIMRSRSLTSLVSGSEDIDGTILVSGKNVMTRGESVVSVTGSSALLLSDGAAAVVGGSAILAGTSGAGVFAGEDYLVPLTTVSVGPIAEDILSKLETVVSTLTDDDKVSVTYSLESLDKMFFRFRSSDECRTTSPWELSGSGEFSLYEPFWVQVSTKFETLRNAGVETAPFDDHTENWDDKTGCPWPGKDALSSAKYVQLSGLSPANLDSDGMNVSRAEVSDRSTFEKKAIFPGYVVRK